MIWIDHHASSIASHPTDIPGYRIDGVAACRLAWQWFTHPDSRRMSLPTKEDFLADRVSEPMAVRLAGLYDVWDHRDGDIEFQFGLRSRELGPDEWKDMLNEDTADPNGELLVQELLEDGRLLQRYQREQDKKAMSRSFLVDFEGLKFLAHNSSGNSLVFDSKDVPETGHDALLSFAFDGKQWTVSMYHAKHRKDLDLSQIAVKYSGGGHAGACGMRFKSLGFDTNLDKRVVLLVSLA